MKELKCRDAGFDCDGSIQGQDDDEVMGKAAAHVSASHPEAELTPDVQANLRGLIHDA